MALANLKPTYGQSSVPPDPNAVDPTKIALQMQTDPSIRAGMAQFFGDPASRHFIQDSGDIGTALSRPDNPWTPGQPVMPAAAPAVSGPSDPQARDMAQFFGTSTGAPAEAATATPGASLATRPAAAAPGAPQAPGMPPTYATAHDYGVAHPEDVSIPPRPVAPMDNVHGARKALLLAFLGLNKFGAGLDHQQNSYADEFLGREMNQTAAQQQYDVSAPQLKHQAEEAAYNNYLGQQAKSAEIQRTVTETGIGPVQQQGEAIYNDILQRYVNRDTPDIAAYAKAKLGGVPAPVANYVQGRLSSMYQVPQTGKGYSINMQDDLPTSINVYGKDYSRNDPELAKLPIGQAAGTDFDRALAAHAQKIKEQRDTAANAAEISGTAQGRGFTQAATMQQQSAQLATEQKGREQMMGPLGDLRAAQNNQQLIGSLGKLASSGDEASQTALVDQLAQAFAPAGSKRLSPIAVDQVVTAGSLSQEAGAKLKKWISGTGPIPMDLVPDFIKVTETLNQSKQKAANDALEDVHSVYGVKHPQAGPTGRLDVRTPAGGGGGGQQKVATSQHIAEYAAQKYPNDPQGVTKATAEFKSAGYTIQ